jgi:hypothetical protein
MKVALLTPIPPPPKGPAPEATRVKPLRSIVPDTDITTSEPDSLIVTNPVVPAVGVGVGVLVAGTSVAVGVGVGVSVGGTSVAVGSGVGVLVAGKGVGVLVVGTSVTFITPAILEWNWQL